MTVFGQLCLLAAFVGSGYAAFACILGWWRRHPAVTRGGHGAAIVSVLALTAVSVVLAGALLAKDFRFAYVAEYCSRLLPWYYALSAFWVGQAGSLLLWAWLLGLLAIGYRFWPRRQPSPLREPAFAVLMAYLCFLVATMVFGADPMQPSIAAPQDGDGLSPLLQHPAMLLHPPVVFLGYAGWAVPFALAVVALISGRLDTTWIREARNWALFSWAVLGIGILLGAYWAYEELGWGGYWSWDPVENGSFLPWLTGTALIHSTMAWQHRGALKKTALLLAVATFALCNFASFLTRSGIFSSLHAFSRSPIGWMFLLLVAGATLGIFILVAWRRRELAPDRPIPSLWTREAVVAVSIVALLLLATVAFAGTWSIPLSDILVGRKVVVGAGFYNRVLIPTGLLLLATTASAPLLRWGSAPTLGQRRGLFLAAGAGGLAAAAALLLGVRHPVALAAAGLSVMAATALVAASILGLRFRRAERPWAALLAAIRDHRRQYAAFLCHLGFVFLAVGVTGSSLGHRQHEVTLGQNETIQWAGRSIRHVQLNQRRLPDKHVVEAELEVSSERAIPYRIRPAQHFYPLHNQWTTEVAVHSTWSGDLYAILHSGEGADRVNLTLMENPMMRWIWLAGWLSGAAALIGIWPARRRVAPPSSMPGKEPRGTRRRRRGTNAPISQVTDG